jgi:hypothetical protein
VNISRRTFIAAGVAGAALLAAARFLATAPSSRRDPSLRALDADGEAIVAAIVPAMLAGALPEDEQARMHAIRDTVAALDGAILGLPAHAQKELDQLFALLASAAARVALARTSASWSAMTLADVQAFLERLRTSRWSLLRAAYDALHQLVMASWYGQPRAWSAIGYGGPPALGAS